MVRRIGEEDHGDSLGWTTLTDLLAIPDPSNPGQLALGMVGDELATDACETECCDDPPPPGCTFPPGSCPTSLLANVDGMEGVCCGTDLPPHPCCSVNNSMLGIALFLFNPTGSPVWVTSTPGNTFDISTTCDDNTAIREVVVDINIRCVECGAQRFWLLTLTVGIEPGAGLPHHVFAGVKAITDCDSVHGFYSMRDFAPIQICDDFAVPNACTLQSFPIAFNVTIL